MSNVFTTNAIFQGQDGSMGYAKGQQYEIKLKSEKGFLVVSQSDKLPVKQHEPVLYESVDAFFANWNGLSIMDVSKEESPLTFGQMAVGAHFNPGSYTDVDIVKRQYAHAIDKLNDLRAAATAEGKADTAKMLSTAITEAQTSQMWAVKAITWQYNK